MTTNQDPQKALRTVQYKEGRHLIRAYLIRLHSSKVAPEEELAVTVASLKGYTLVIFCRFLENALLEGLSAKAQVVKLRAQIDPDEARFDALAVRFAMTGCALLRKKTVGYRTAYQAVCLGRVVETFNGIDAAERFLQQNTIGDSHVAA